MISQPVSQKIGGFSLLEMAILILIIGLLLGPILSLYQGNKLRKQYETVNEDLQAIYEALNEFQGNNGAYPCPAGRNVPQGDPDNGKPVCFADPLTPPPGECLNGVCRVMSQRDVDGDGTVDDVTVLIGVVPYEVLNNGADATVLPQLPLPAMIGNKQSRVAAVRTVDPWGRRYLYAVTESMVVPETFVSNGGAIGVFDENNQSLTREPFSAHVAILSHGVNGAGAWSQAGSQTNLCSTGRVDQENCDLDGRFISGLMNLGLNTNYFDDFVMFIDFNSTNLWTMSNTVPNAIYNATLGNVGVGVNSPVERLHLAEPLRTNQLHTREFCDSAGTLCYSPNLIAGDEPSMQCPAGEAAYGISEGQVRCRPIPSSTVGNFSCPPNRYMVGISNFGRVLCCPVVSNRVDCTGITP